MKKCLSAKINNLEYQYLDSVRLVRNGKLDIPGKQTSTFIFVYIIILRITLSIKFASSLSQTVQK